MADNVEHLGAKDRIIGFLGRHSVVFAKWAEVNLACACNTACPSCIGVAAGSLLIPLVAEESQSLRQPQEETHSD